MMTDGIDLPASVRGLVELSPVEDILLAVLREAFPDMEIASLIPEDPTFPMVLVRRAQAPGDWRGDDRFTDTADVDVQVFTEDPDGDSKGALVSEAVRVALRNAWLNHARVPGRGSIIAIRMTNDPRQVPDWATATGPVQYADLPSGIRRYQSAYSVEIRKERPGRTTP